MRPRPARLVLLSLGVLAGAVASGLLFGLGDRLTQGDPAVLLVGGGALASAGALVGMAMARLDSDGPAVADRIRPATADLHYRYAGRLHLDEAVPHSLGLRVAPTYAFAGGHGRLRLLGHVGGWLNPAREVDPRPSVAQVNPDQQGTAPVTLRQRRLRVGVALDMAVNLPYPVLKPRRSAHLGSAELRYKPEVQIRRDRLMLTDTGTTSHAELVEHTMLLPLTVGMRWNLSPRQRFTVTMGPRFDFVAVAGSGQAQLQRGEAQIGPLYGEAWYDLDVPLAPRRTAHPHRVMATGQLSLGYVHSRFDGRGFNIGPVIGFLGPFHVLWSTRIRPVGSPVALQVGAGAQLGDGLAFTLSAGVAAPNLPSRRRTEQP